MLFKGSTPRGGGEGARTAGEKCDGLNRGGKEKGARTAGEERVVARTVGGRGGAQTAEKLLVH